VKKFGLTPIMEDLAELLLSSSKKPRAGSFEQASVLSEPSNPVPSPNTRETYEEKLASRLKPEQGAPEEALYKLLTCETDKKN